MFALPFSWVTGSAFPHCTANQPHESTESRRVSAIEACVTPVQQVVANGLSFTAVRENRSEGLMSVRGLLAQDEIRHNPLSRTAYPSGWVCHYRRL